VIFFDDDPTSTVSVWQPRGTPENTSIVVNGKSDGSLEGDYGTMALAALVPALMAERHERSFVIGLGTGVTAGVLAALDGSREVTVAEISRAVIAASPLFDHGNGAVSKDPKIRVKRGDAYRTLLRSSGGYDVIVSEPSNPWVTGVEMLYSREFLEAARSSLNPGGVFCQWFHLYETNADVVDLVLRTYTAVFPHVSAWFALGHDLLLLGFDRPARALDVDGLEDRFGQPDFTAGFAKVEIESFPQLLAHELLPLGTLHAADLEGPIHTLRHPILSHRAARAFFPAGRRTALPIYLSDEHQAVSRRNSLLRRHAAADGSYTEEALEAAARETCRFKRLEDCLAFLARWASEHPDSPRLKTVRAEVRESLGAKKEKISPVTLRTARAFFDGKLATNRFTAEKATAMTDQFITYYNHVIPFDVGVLEMIWNRCRGPRCASARREAERELGMQEDGFGDFPTPKRGGATRHLASPPETSPATLSPNPESDQGVKYR